MISCIPPYPPKQNEADTDSYSEKYFRLSQEKFDFLREKEKKDRRIKFRNTCLKGAGAVGVTVLLGMAHKGTLPKYWQNIAASILPNAMLPKKPDGILKTMGRGLNIIQKNMYQAIEINNKIISSAFMCYMLNVVIPYILRGGIPVNLRGKVHADTRSLVVQMTPHEAAGL